MMNKNLVLGQQCSCKKYIYKINKNNWPVKISYTNNSNQR